MLSLLLGVGILNHKHNSKCIPVIYSNGILCISYLHNTYFHHILSTTMLAWPNLLLHWSQMVPHMYILSIVYRYAHATY